MSEQSADYDAGVCPTPCDDDCLAPCHETHVVPAKRTHDPVTCPGVIPPGEWDEEADALFIDRARDAMRNTPPEEGDSITCPRCGRTSHNPNDVREGYCGACRDWTTPKP